MPSHWLSQVWRCLSIFLTVAQTFATPPLVSQTFASKRQHEGKPMRFEPAPRVSNSHVLDFKSIRGHDLHADAHLDAHLDVYLLSSLYIPPSPLSIISTS
ncbi:hypothetical protein CROQUDRAFT_94148 [Cronartium quercuum f. sp. fusiforme G11]|uniref:Secreted protein n=1 Tax=Cronartium quercuum f. sp. fusiforme G11 TaxID=708437 RepID=A0A9P6NKF1_9BASI|nr:hypothetical protein CROQUDRAFT_94148 [Cronartium quercuum f. sp. fusiforme G11]